MFANLTSFILCIGFMISGDYRALIASGLFAIAGAITFKTRITINNETKNQNTGNNNTN